MLYHGFSISQPSTSADNTELGLNISGYPAQPHPIIIKNLMKYLLYVYWKVNHFN